MHKILIIFLVPLDILAWMNCPNEVYTVPFTSVNKLFDVLLFTFGIRQTPVR